MTVFLGNGSSCVCKASERSIQRRLHGKYKGEFIPRLIKQGIKKEKPCCCVPGCGKTSKRSYVFADFDIICEGAKVSVSEKYIPYYVSVQSIIMPPTNTADVLVSVDCVVVKVNTVLVVTSIRL